MSHTQKYSAQVMIFACVNMIKQVTFVSPVHIRKIMVIGGGDEESHPSAMKVFVNTGNFHNCILYASSLSLSHTHTHTHTYTHTHTHIQSH
jgi:hypothetical protein